MQAYLDLLSHILDKGKKKSDRTGTGTLSCFGYQMRFSLQEGFPLLTTKKIHLKSVIYELLWFLKGDTNIKYLQDNGVSIWNEWADETGELGPVYGKQWRRWGTEEIDQISALLEQLKTNPHSRRHIVSAWNVAEVNKMALPPCHTLFQFYVADKELSCSLYQRSADVFLGVPFNIASYALLTLMIAKTLDLHLGDFVHNIGDAHLYLNHIEQAKKQLTRTPRALPSLRCPKKDSLFDYVYEDFILENYQPYPGIKAPIAV